MKKSSRVFKTKHACIFCGKLVAKPSKHMKTVHADEKLITDLENIEDDKEKTKMLALMRNQGNHKHNTIVKDRKYGEILLARRPQGTGFKLENFKPCPNCDSRVNNLGQHRSYSDRCICKTGKMGKKEVELKSNLKVGKFSAQSTLMQSVLVKMRDDECGKVAKGDRLILQLGEAGLRKNVKNKLRRGNYASSKMRLCAKMLMELRIMTKQPQATWYEMLHP